MYPTARCEIQLIGSPKLQVSEAKEERREVCSKSCFKVLYGSRVGLVSIRKPPVKLVRDQGRNNL